MASVPNKRIAVRENVSKTPTPRNAMMNGMVPLNGNSRLFMVNPVRHVANPQTPAMPQEFGLAKNPIQRPA